jgi:hypothetical protein
MKITISNLSYPIRKNKTFRIINRLMSVIILSGIFLWSNQKIITSHQIVNICPPLGICLIVLGAVAVTIFIVEPIVEYLILRLKGLKVITDDTSVKIISRNAIIEQDEDYYCCRVKVGDKWEIIKLAHRMKKSDRPDYLKDDDDTMD